MDGDHTIDESYHVTERTLRAVFMKALRPEGRARRRC